MLTMRRTKAQFVLTDESCVRVSRCIAARQTCCAVIACAVLTLLVNDAHADFGPKLIDQVRVDVNLDGRPIGNDAIGVLLVPAEEGVSGPQNAAKQGPGLDIPYVDRDGRKWSYGDYLWGGRFENGAVDFRGFFQGTGRMPSSVRLAVILPQDGQQFVTNAVRPSRHLALLRAELSTTGDARLQSVPTPLWGRLDFFKALLITLLIECVLVGYIATRRPTNSPFAKKSRKADAARVVAVCFIVNFFSLPVLWFVTGHFFFVLGFTKGLQIFLCLEVAVLLAESVAYGLFTKLGWKTAFLAALIANVTTCLLGFVF